jgi:D-cysteine desulfhydrase
MMQPPLFGAFPCLSQRLPWHSLLPAPTPVHPLPDLGPLWIKRDDASSEVYGGSKVRKLEFLLGEALSQNRGHVITMGAIGSHHAAATAAFCRQLGLSCETILCRQPLTAEVCANLARIQGSGARIRYAGSPAVAAALYLRHAAFRRRGTYLIPPGGSSPRGVLGLVNAVFELRDQIAEGRLPRPYLLVCPLGTGGMVAGFALGCFLAGLDCQVIGVRVYPARHGIIPLIGRGALRRLIRRTAGLIERSGGRLPRGEPREPVILDGYLGRGYGHPTAEGQAAQRRIWELARIGLEPTYTAKAFAATIDALALKPGEGPVLFWNSCAGRDSPLGAREASSWGGTPPCPTVR